MGAWLDDLRRVGDPSADAVIGDLARTQQIRAVIPVPADLERRWTASGVFPDIDNELIQIAQAQPA